MSSVLLVEAAGPEGLLKRQLERDQPDLRILGTVTSLPEALEFLETENPDFVYLSWEMAGDLQAEVLHFLALRSQVVFVTAFGSHRIHALEAGPSQNPPAPFPSPKLPGGKIKPPHLAPTLSSKNQAVPAGDAGKAAGTLEAVRRVNSPDMTEIVPLDEILWIEASQNYSKVFRKGNGRDFLFHKSMVAWERILPHDSFLRLSRSLIIRLTSVQKLTSGGRDETSVGFKGSKKQLQLGRAAALRLKAVFRHRR